ncbi:MAG: GAF domain-containing protein [Armatimonadota bacterium]|nr:GAF domain-containing protein [Armatimonadota bacterium]
MGCSRENTILSALVQAAGSTTDPDQRVQAALDALRDALELEAASIIVSQLPAGVAKTWASVRGGGSHSHRRSVDDELSNGSQSAHLLNQAAAVPLSISSGCNCSLVLQGLPRRGIDATLLDCVAVFLSVLVENAWLTLAEHDTQELTRRRIEEIAAIYEIGKAVDSATPKAVFDLIVTKAASVMDAQTCSLMLLDEIDGCLVIEASYGLAPDIVKGTRIRLGEGIAGQVAASGEPVLLTDVASDTRFEKKVVPHPDVSGSMCVPLKNRDGQVKGVLSIRRHHPKPPFTQDDLLLFCVFATHAALAIENAELYARLHQRIQEISTVSNVLQAINSTLDVGQVLEKIVRGITEVVGFDRCCLYLLDPRTGELVAGARVGYSSADGVAERIKLGEGVVGLAAKERVPIFSREVAPPRSNTEDASSSTRQELFEFLAVPIMVHDACIGVVAVDNRITNRHIGNANIEMLAAFVNQAGIAVENARLYEAMERKYAEMNALYEHTRTLSAAYGVESAAEALVSACSKMLGCDGAALFLLEPGAEKLRLLAPTGQLSGIADHTREHCSDKRFLSAVRALKSPLVLDCRGDSVVQTSSGPFDRVFRPSRSRVLLVPLVTEDTTMGLLALADSGAGEFQGSEIKLITILTAHAATVLKNALSYELKMQQRVLELSALYEFSRQISSADSLDEALNSVLSVVAGMVDCDDLFIYAVDRERNAAVVRARKSGNQPDLPLPEEPLDGGSFVSWVIRERKALISPDISADPRFSEVAARWRWTRSLMAIPLIVQDEVVGVLTVCSNRPSRFTEEQVKVLSIVASQGAAIYKELEALNTLSNYTDSILASVAAGVVTLDTEGVVLTWNNAAEKITGLAASRAVGLDYRDVLSRLNIPETEAQRVEQAIETVCRTGETFRGYKICFHPHDSPEVFLNMSVSLLRNSAGENLGVVVIFEDVSREIHLEEEFARVRELAAVGQLAATIAHELRNPLSSIKGAAQFLQKEYADHAAIVEFLSIIIEEVNGLNKLTTEFLEFARPLKPDPKPVDLNKLIDNTLQLMGVNIRESGVALSLKLESSLPTIEADPRQLEQVLKNIIINALQAMPNGGELTIETGSTTDGGAYFAVSDTGVGIPADKIERIFQPFVTTKTKGTGLGLSVCRKIVDSHGGSIEVSSRPGEGSTFKVILPRSAVQRLTVEEADLTLERRS